MSQITSNDDIPVLTALTEDQVADYLRRNPGFLADKPGLLAAMSLPHHTKGEAISLIERQVSVLRDRNVEMRHRLNKLLDNARTNDQLFERSRRLILSLLDARQFDDCLDALFYSFQNDFDIHFTKVLLINPPELAFPKPANQQAEIVDRQLAMTSLSSIIHNHRTVCGQLDASECQFIFQDYATEIGSTAVAPLRQNNLIIGILAIANRDPDYYRSSMNTLFLNFITDVLGCMLSDYLVNALPME